MEHYLKYSHPELKEGEIYYTNTLHQKFDNIPYRSKRKIRPYHFFESYDSVPKEYTGVAILESEYNDPDLEVSLRLRQNEIICTKHLKHFNLI